MDFSTMSYVVIYSFTFLITERTYFYENGGAEHEKCSLTDSECLPPFSHYLLPIGNKPWKVICYEMGLRYFRKEKQYLEMTDFGNMPNSIEYSGNVYKFIF